MRIAAAGILIAMVPVQAAVTWSHDVAPVVYQYCAQCHRPGEAGPFALLTYDDVKKHARQIADLTHRRVMPPWLPDPGPFQDQLRLTDDQIRMFAEWAAAGAPEGDASETPAPPKFTEGWQLGPPDLVLEASEPYHLPASGTDYYWNFVFTAHVPTRKWVRAIEIRPGDRRLVHHANLYVDRAHSASPSGAGFPGMDFVIERPINDPDDGHFLYWKPGGIPYSEPDGFAWRLDPNDDLVLNAHMQPSGKPELVRPQVGLYFTDHPQAHFPMVLQLQDDNAINIPPGAHDYLVSDDFDLPMDVDVLAIYPHAHYLGKVLEAYATLPSGCRKPLIRIGDWNRNWEAVYRYKEPVFLPRGSTISMRFHYDNSTANVRNPHNPPKRVRAGNTAMDEMGHLYLQVLPRGGRDRRVELQEALLRHRIEKYPTDYEAHMHLGAIRLARFDPSGAAAELQLSLRGLPTNPEAHNELGSAMLAMGRNTEAIEQFRMALKLRPEYPNARYNLARALIKSGRLVEATSLYRQVVAAFPNDPEAHDGLGDLLFREGQFEEALKEFDRALEIDPKFENAKADREQTIQALHK